MLRQAQKRVKQWENEVRTVYRIEVEVSRIGANALRAGPASDYSASDSPREASSVPFTRSSDASDLM